MLWGGDPIYISQPIRVERAMANYWLKHNSNSLAEGPYNASQLKAMAAVGQISKEALISNDREKWTPATQVKGLFPSPAAPVPTIPPAPIPAPPPDLAPRPAPSPTPDAYDVQEPEPPPVPRPGTFNAGVPGQAINPVQLAYAGSYGVGGFSGYGVVGRVRNVKWFLITAIVIVVLFVLSQVLSGASQVFFARTSVTPRSSRLVSRSAPPPAPGQLAAVAVTGALGCFSELALFGMAIYWFVWIGTIHSELYAFNTAVFPTSPGMAVGFCFIPFFNLYWIPSMMYRAADGIDRHLGGGRISTTQVLVFHILAIVPGCCMGLGLIFYALAMMEVQKGLNELWTRYSVHSAQPPAIPGV